MQYGSITSTITQNQNYPVRQVLRLREHATSANTQSSVQPLRLRTKRTYGEMINSYQLTPEQVKSVRLSKLGGLSQHPKLTLSQKAELAKEYKAYQTRLFFKQAYNFGPTPFQSKVMSVEGDRSRNLGVIRNYDEETRLLNVIEQQPFEMSLAQLRSLLHKRNNIQIDENLIPNETAIRQNIPEPFNLLNNTQIRSLILIIMSEQNERKLNKGENEFLETDLPKDVGQNPDSNCEEIQETF